MPVCVLSANGERLMPTENYGKVRHLLKDGRAVIAKRNPFTIQLTYDTSTYTQPIEMCVGTGYEHIGVSIKTKAKEVVSQQYDMLTNERSRHDDCRAYRRTRRNRLRYRAARFNNRVSGKKPGWIAPSLDNKVERHLDIISRYLSVMPVTDVFIKAATYDTQLLAALETHGKRELPVLATSCPPAGRTAIITLTAKICAGSVAVRSQRAEPRPESRDMPCSREISWSTAIANTFPRAAPAMAGH